MSTSLKNKCATLIYNKKERHKKGEKINIDEELEMMTESINQLVNTYSNCYILGYGNLANLVQKKFLLHHELDQHFATKGIEYDLKYVDDILDKNHEISKEINSLYQEAYQSLYQ